MAQIGDVVAERLTSEVPQVQIGAAWALAWFGQGRFWTIESNIKVLNRLFFLWATTSETDVSYFTAWAITSLPLRSSTFWGNLKTENGSPVIEKVNRILNTSDSDGEDRQTEAALMYAMYNRSLVAERDRHLKMLKDRSRAVMATPAKDLLVAYLECDTPQAFDAEKIAQRTGP